MRYQGETGIDLHDQRAVSFDSESSILHYIDAHKERFDHFRTAGHSRIRDAVTPVVAAFGHLCTIAGEGVGLAFGPSKVVFGAVGELCKAAVEVRDELDSISDAFDTMAHHLRILRPVVERDVHQDDALREASIKLLAQILVVLGVIQKVRKQGRLVLWLRKLAKSKEVASALAELSRLASSHHETVTAVTLYTAKETMSILTESNAWNREEQAMTRACLACITRTAQDIHGMLCKSVNLTFDQHNANRGILERVQKELISYIERTDIQTESADIDQLCTWLQFPDCSDKMTALLDGREQSTGSWFLDGEDFTAFKERRAKSIWLHGKAGCGKSTMIAAAIQDLRVEAATSDAVSLTLTHLFDTTGASPRNLRAFLSSVLCQLAYNLPQSRWRRCDIPWMS